MKIKTIGIVGYGHFGKFLVVLAKRFLPEVEVRVYSRRSEPDEQLFFNLKDTAESDVVILCGSIREYEEQLKAVLEHAFEDTILVDVATVKKHPTEAFKRLAPERKWLSCHPMFGPESYKKTNGDVTGYRIVITDYTLVNNDFLLLKEALSRLGFVVIEMTADEHDKLLAETLFLTHYIGQTMHRAGFERTNIDTVSFSSLMNAVESVRDDSQLFADVYRYNPYCNEVAKRFHDAQEGVFESLSEVSDK